MENNPIFYDIKDLEREIVMLEKTIEELSALAEAESNADEAHELRLIVVENEFAIEEKIRKRKDLRDALGMTGEDHFVKDRRPHAEGSQRSSEPSGPILIGVEDTKGIML